ncbi:hypothetical protein E2C01_053792 [Portunus trituberculatus]|uniref:Uncharacterized protein n=1 Tax=Portunus trituberculatus TaxID=210409 RepID=A0A5B7GT79_PORTR|nr:hypothetical protein [Portunus trituberculatus]
MCVVLCDVSKCTPPHSPSRIRITHILYLTDPPPTRISPRPPLGQCCPSRFIQAGRAGIRLSLQTIPVTDFNCCVWSRNFVCFELKDKRKLDKQTDIQTAEGKCLEAFCRGREEPCAKTGNFKHDL